MSAMKRLERPGLYPGHTVWRQTAGPVVYCGELITGVHVFLSERESREVLHAWGWPTPEQHAELKAGAEALLARFKELEAELEHERAHKVVAVSDMVGLVERLRVDSRTLGAAAQVSTCSAVKADGEACTARALPGLRVCGTHSRQPAGQAA